ncbi:MAG TPA: radical SAM protein [Dissulfurispiraceae bacterium]
MAIKRISFIEVGASGLQMLSRYTVARVGTVLLSTILKEMGYEVRAFIEDIAAPDWTFIENSDLVCISTLTATAPKAYRTGEKLREKGIPVVMGGVHPTFLPEEALRYSDFVIRGEGDHALPLLLRSLETGSPSLKDIGGLSYRDKRGTVMHNPPGKFLDERELDRLPTPDFSLVHKWRPSLVYPLSTSRGCPFDCKFCSVIHVFGRKYRFKSVENVLGELKGSRSVSKATRFFVDDNFTAHKNRSKELLRGMIAEGLTEDWVAQARTDVAADPELLRLMADAGCHTLYIGFESINPKTLAAYNKKQELDDIVKCVRRIKEHGMHIHGMFVLGADTDDVGVIERTADFAADAGIDTMQLAVLTPLPGTPLFDEMKESGRLLHTDWSKYNVQHVVFEPARMTPKTLQLEIVKGMGRFYSWKYILGHLAKLDFHYFAIGLFGKKLVHKASREARAYIESLHAGTPKTA